MFGLGFGEIAIIAVVFLIFVGPKRLPEVMRTLGGWMREVSKAKEEFTRTLNEDESLRDLKSSAEKLRSDVKSRVNQVRKDLTEEVPSKKEVGFEVETDRTEGYE